MQSDSRDQNSVYESTALSSKYRIIHLVRTQNFMKNKHLLLADMHTYVCVWGGKKCLYFGKFCVRAKWVAPKVYVFQFSWKNSALSKDMSIALLSLFVNQQPLEVLIFFMFAESGRLTKLAFVGNLSFAQFCPEIGIFKPSKVHWNDFCIDLMHLTSQIWQI